MVALLSLTAGPARLALAPDLGGGIARLDVNGCPVLRPFAGDAEDLFSLAGNVLLPFSNRISKGGFTWDGAFHPIAPNLAGEPFPIHGDGFQRAWSAETRANAPRLHLTDGEIGPWRYAAEQGFTLTDNSLTIDLTATNTGDAPLPFGGGYHPWFPRDAQTRLSFAATSVWTANDRHLPVAELPLSQRPDWDFSAPRALPSGLIDNAFCGWGRTARIDQGQGAVSCRISADAALPYAHVYSPNADAPFFCFEPVSHSVDAVHLDGAPGLQVLAPGAQWTARVTIDWDLK